MVFNYPGVRCYSCHSENAFFSFFFFLPHFISGSEPLFSLFGRGRVNLCFAMLKSFCERLPQAIIVFLFYMELFTSFHVNDKIRETPVTT